MGLIKFFGLEKEYLQKNVTKKLVFCRDCKHLNSNHSTCSQRIVIQYPTNYLLASYVREEIVDRKAKEVNAHNNCPDFEKK